MWENNAMTRWRFAHQPPIHSSLLEPPISDTWKGIFYFQNIHVHLKIAVLISMRLVLENIKWIKYAVFRLKIHLFKSLNWGLAFEKILKVTLGVKLIVNLSNVQLNVPWCLLDTLLAMSPPPESRGLLKSSKLVVSKAWLWLLLSNEIDIFHVVLI